jgi:hypothetical protein
VCVMVVCVRLHRSCAWCFVGFASRCCFVDGLLTAWVRVQRSMATVTVPILFIGV